ncbi:MAG: hypothetical protein R3C15_00415 [Thermoleophilia bacterium]
MTGLRRLREALRDWPASGTFLAEEVALAAYEWRDERPPAPPPQPAARVAPAADAPRLAAA